MENIKQIYGRNIKMLRKEKGYTLQFLAQRVGITHQQLSRIENGGGTSSSTLERIATVLAVSVSTLTTDKEPVIQSTSEYKNFVHGNVCEQMYNDVINVFGRTFNRNIQIINDNAIDNFIKEIFEQLQPSNNDKICQIMYKCIDKKDNYYFTHSELLGLCKRFALEYIGEIIQIAKNKSDCIDELEEQEKLDND